mgnify:FL=1
MQEIHLGGRQRIKSQEMAFTGLFAALIAAGAYMRIDIPVQPFPMHFTLQFFFVLLAGYVLGARRGAACVCVYLAVGLAGIPVFAAGGGPAYLIRPTFGFLIGFVAAAWITGKLCWKRPGGGVAWRLFSAFWGMMAYYLCGMVYFYVISNYVIHMPVSWKLVVINCFLITVAEDFILCVMAAVVARRLMPFALGQYR